jgi:hypothetical protein
MAQPAMINPGTVDAAAFTAAARMWFSDDPCDWFEQIERIAKIPLIETCVQARAACYNYGFRVNALGVNGRSPSEAQRSRLEKWMDAESGEAKLRGESLANHLAMSAWASFELYDNVVASWMESSSQPSLLALKDCVYTSNLGNPVLKWKHRISAQTIRSIAKELARSGSISDADVEEVCKRYRDDTIRLQDPVWNQKMPSLADYYAIATASPIASGFAKPSITGLFASADQFQSMEAGESGLAWLARSPEKQVKLGYEPKASNSNGRTIIDSKRVKAVHSDWAKKSGPRVVTTPFDQQVVYNWVPKDMWDNEKWKTTTTRISMWCGPVAYLLLEPTQSSDYQLGILRINAERRREMMRPFLERVIGEFAGVRVRVSWSNACFYGPGTLSEILRNAVSQGAMSYETLVDNLLGEGAFEAEMAKKKAERAAYGDLLRPHFDQHHGVDGTPGRPKGAKDPQA